MKNYKAYYIITSLSERELDLFEDFLKSPYHNTRGKPLELFRIINKIKTRPQAEITKEKIFDKLYPGKKFNANTFNDLMAQLHKLAEDFLFIESVQKDEFKKTVELLGVFLEGRFSSLFEQKRNHFDKMAEKDNIIGSFFLWNTYVKDAYYLSYIQGYKNIRSKTEIKQVIETLYSVTLNMTNLYLEEIAAAFLQSHTRRNEIYSSGFPVLINQIIKKVFDNKFLNLLKDKNKYYFNIVLLKDLLNLFTSKNIKKSYLTYKKSLSLYRKKLTYQQMNYHYTFLLGHVLSHSRASPQNVFFRNEVSALFDITISNKYYTTTNVNYFRPTLYGSFLNTFFKIKNEKKIKQMVEVCIPLLEKRFANFYKKLSLSFISFIAKDYEKALEHINGVKIHHKRMENFIRIYIIKLHFLLGNTEQVLNLSDTFAKYVNSNLEDDDMLYKQRTHFIKFIKKIVLLREKEDFSELKFLTTQIKKEPDISEKQWLIETLYEILKSK